MMKMRLFSLSVRSALVILLSLSSMATGAELKVMSAIGVRGAMENLGPKFEQASGHKLVFIFDSLGNMLKRIENGETGDVVVLPAPGIDSLAKERKVAVNDVSSIAKSYLGVAIRKGISKPDISSPEAFKRTMLDAKAIVLPDPARGGFETPHIFKVFERLGIAEKMQDKILYTKVPGTAGFAQAMAMTEAAVGLSQLQTFVPIAEMEIVGPLPGDLGLATLFSAAVMDGSENPEAAKALVNFLQTPEAAVVIKAQGLEPAFP